MCTLLNFYAFGTSCNKDDINISADFHYVFPSAEQTQIFIQSEYLSELYPPLSKMRKYATGLLEEGDLVNLGKDESPRRIGFKEKGEGELFKK